MDLQTWFLEKSPDHHTILDVPTSSYIGVWQQGLLKVVPHSHEVKWIVIDE